ncbi:MAG: signal recognition particle-docking protein FtsY [Eubacteriaceae bacterium]|nr:signal recognition particle-docking protein FtsY [Eubacteriaceae bacterium]MDD4507899.1 signal recognition particle-docking protein FtsY [Eubacteriaceae bacterium]
MASFYQRMKNKLSNTKDNFKEKLDHVMYYHKLDDDFFDDLEETLILSDMGIDTSVKIVEALKMQIRQTGTKTTEDVKVLLEQIMSDMVDVASPTVQTPVIMMVVGVNGVGKTTTIAKLASQYLDEGKKVMVAAADTFRAAAVEQLEIWADRIGVDIIKSNTGADPASVIFDAIHAAKARKVDYLICDTAGRLHNKVNLMNELEKLTWVIEREGSEFNKHNLLVLDATTGQNALIQARTFNDAVHLDGMVMTKLDGTAKGGVVIPIISELQVPVEYVGIGEKKDDLIPFDAHAFVHLLYDESDQPENSEEN